MATEQAKLIIRGENHTDLAFRAVKRNLGDLDSTGRTLRNTFAALGITLSTGLFVRMIKDTIDAGDNFAKMSERVGVAASTLSQFAYAAKLSDVQITDMETGIGALAKSMAYAGEGMATYQRYFEQLNVQFKDSTGKLRPISEVMGDIADRFAAMQDGSQKTALAMLLFQNAGRQMIPMLNQGREGIQAMLDASVKLGVAWSDKDAQAAQTLNNELVALNAQFDHMKLALATDLIPALTRLISKFNEARGAGEGFWQSLKSAVGVSDLQIAQKELTDAVSRRLEVERQLAKFAHLAGTTGWAKALVPQLKAELKELDARIEMARAVIQLAEHPVAEPPAAKPKAKKSPAAQGTEDKAALQKLLDEQTQQLVAAAEEATQANFTEAQALAAANDEITKQAEAWKDVADPMRTYDRQLKEIDELVKQHRLTQEEAGKATAEVEKKRLEAYKATIEQTQKTDGLMQQLGATFQSAFENALVAGDSFRDVMKGLEQDILRVFLRLKVIEPLMESIFGGGKGGGGGVLASLGKIFGFQHGGGFTVPGSGGTDSSLVAFRATPGERVTVSRPDQAGSGGGGVVFNLGVHVDARADISSVRSAIAQSVAAARETLIREARTGGAFARAVGKA